MSEGSPPSDPDLTWCPARDANTNEILDAERVGDLFDGDVWVGHARFLEHGAPNREEDKARVWNWSVFPFPGFCRDHTVEMGGRERSKEEAKAAAEAAYRRICDIPGARDENLKHTRVLMQMRAAGRARMAAGGGLPVPPAVDRDAEDDGLDDDDDHFHGAFAPLAADFAAEPTMNSKAQAYREQAAECVQRAEVP